MKQSTVCESTFQLGDGTCGRSMLSLLAPIFMYKLLFGIILGALPVIMSEGFAKVRILFASWNEQTQSTLNKIEFRLSSIGLIVGSGLREPNAMSALSFVEPALVLGVTFPALIFILGVQLGTAALAHEYFISDAPSSRGEVQPKGFIREPMVVMMVVVSTCQALWCVFYAFDNRFAGHWVVLAVGAGVALAATVMGLWSVVFGRDLKLKFERNAPT